MKTTHRKVDGFIARDETVWSKLERFREQGADKLHVILDFDHTLTAGVVPGRNAATWEVMHEALPEELKPVHDALFQKYRPIEVAHQLTDELSERWYTEALDLFSGSGMNIRVAEDRMIKVIKAREGSLRLFQNSHDARVPVVVLSAGVKQMIRVILDKYKLNPDLVLATDFIVRPNGKVAGWKKETLIHSLNKREQNHTQLSSIKDERPNVIVVGDELSDAAMVNGEALRIRVFDPRIGETVDELKYEKESFAAGYDLIVKYSLEPVADLVGHIASPKTHNR